MLATKDPPPLIAFFPPPTGLSLYFEDGHDDLDDCECYHHFSLFITTHSTMPALFSTFCYARLLVVMQTGSSREFIKHSSDVAAKSACHFWNMSTKSAWLLKLSLTQD